MNTPNFILYMCAIALFAIIGYNHKMSDELAASKKRTLLTVKNSSQTDTITVYLTLGGCQNCITDVHNVLGIKTHGMQGSFILRPNESRTYVSPVKKAFEGNIAFLKAPVNCPDGTTLCEFALNNYSPTDNKAQETVEISCVAGVNYIAKYTMRGGGSWTATTGYENITSMQNDTIGANSGKVGVYPYGCDDCTSQSSGAPSCTIGKNETPQKLPICNVSRNARESGGNILIEYIKSVNQ